MDAVLKGSEDTSLHASVDKRSTDTAENEMEDVSMANDIKEEYEDPYVKANRMLELMFSQLEEPDESSILNEDSNTNKELNKEITNREETSNRDDNVNESQEIHVDDECGKEESPGKSPQVNNSNLSRNFICPVCNKGFGRKDHLIRHVRGIHVGKEISHSVNVLEMLRNDKIMNKSNELSPIKSPVKSLNETDLLKENNLNTPSVKKALTEVNVKRSARLELSPLKSPAKSSDGADELKENNPLTFADTNSSNDVNTKHKVRKNRINLGDILRLFYNEKLLEDNLKFSENKTEDMKFQNKIPKKKFFCPKCKKCYGKSSHLKRHIKTSHTVNKVSVKKAKSTNNMSQKNKLNVSVSVQRQYNHICPKCDFKFDRTKYLNRHMKIHEERNFECSECGKSFTKQDQLEIHTRIHRGLEVFVCDTCGKIYDEEKTLSVHKNNNHNLKAAKLKSVSNKGEKKKSNASTIKEYTYKCPKCDIAFSCTSHLKRHAKLHEERNFECLECGKSFTKEKELETHKRIHKGLEVFACNLCFKKYDEESALNVHKRVHSKAANLKSVNNKGEKKKSNISKKSKSNASTIKEYTFKCLKCDFAFSCTSRLKRHAKLHEEMNFECLECGKSFTKEKQLETHKRIHKGLEVFACNLCFKMYEEESALNVHKRTHSKAANLKSVNNKGEKKKSNASTIKEYTYKCPKCDFAFSCTSHLKRHAKLHEERNFECSECGKGFTKQKLLETHTRIHNGLEVFPCNICGKIYDEKSTLKAHENIHSKGANLKSVNKKGKKKKVDKNKKNVSKKAILLKKRSSNKKEHSSDDNSNFKCSKCQTSFSSMARLNRHMKLHDERNFDCSVCGKCFLKENKLVLHMKVHTGETVYSCSICSKEFELKKSLSKHMKNKHSGKKTNGNVIKCPVCSKSFNRNSNMTRHLRKQHSDENKEKLSIEENKQPLCNGKDENEEASSEEKPVEKVFKCPICSKCFAQNSNMLRHQRNKHETNDSNKNPSSEKVECSKTHSKTKLFGCKQCDKSYNTERSLERHMLTHDGSNDFPCVFCKKMFTKESLISDHILKSHTEEKPHICPICIKEFKTKKDFHKHMLFHSMKMKLERERKIRNKPPTENFKVGESVVYIREEVSYMECDNSIDENTINGNTSDDDIEVLDPLNI